ncbi:hypothetical protein GCM10023097_45690 [Streptomyces collinus]
MHAGAGDRAVFVLHPASLIAWPPRPGGAVGRNRRDLRYEWATASPAVTWGGLGSSSASRSRT